MVVETVRYTSPDFGKPASVKSTRLSATTAGKANSWRTWYHISPDLVFRLLAGCCQQLLNVPMVLTAEVRRERRRAKAAPFPRPRGGSPSGCTWDEQQGGWWRADGSAWRPAKDCRPSLSSTGDSTHFAQLRFKVTHRPGTSMQTVEAQTKYVHRGSHQQVNDPPSHPPTHP